MRYSIFAAIMMLASACGSQNVARPGTQQAKNALEGLPISTPADTDSRATARWAPNSAGWL